MSLIVQKFGGSSVADADKIRNVARIITDTYKQGHDVVAVLSAQGDTTDDLIEKASEINPDASKREMDMLLSTGEQISCSLCAMAIEAMGCPVVSHGLASWIPYQFRLWKCPYQTSQDRPAGEGIGSAAHCYRHRIPGHQ